MGICYSGLATNVDPAQPTNTRPAASAQTQAEPGQQVAKVVGIACQGVSAIAGLDPTGLASKVADFVKKICDQYEEMKNNQADCRELKGQVDLIEGIVIKLRDRQQIVSCEKILNELEICLKQCLELFRSLTVEKDFIGKIKDFLSATSNKQVITKLTQQFKDLINILNLGLTATTTQTVEEIKAMLQAKAEEALPKLQTANRVIKEEIKQFIAEVERIKNTNTNTNTNTTTVNVTIGNAAALAVDPPAPVAPKLPVNRRESNILQAMAEHSTPELDRHILQQLQQRLIEAYKGERSKNIEAYNKVLDKYRSGLMLCYIENEHVLYAGAERLENKTAIAKVAELLQQTSQPSLVTPVIRIDGQIGMPGGSVKPSGFVPIASVTSPLLFSVENKVAEVRVSTPLKYQKPEDHPLIASKLRDPHKELTVEESIELLTQCIQYGNEQADKALERDLIILIGNTGAGKSTFANYLAGCTMAFKSPEELGIDALSDIVVVVPPPHGVAAEVMPIGHTKESKTFMPQIETPEISGSSVAGTSYRFTYCDCPGFLDNRGAEINIANAVNIKNTIKKARSVKVVILINYYSLKADRGRGLTDMFKICCSLFGSAENLTRYKASILIGVTNVEQDLKLSNLRKWITKDALPLMHELATRIFMFDPIDRAPGESGRWLRGELLAEIARLPKITEHRKIFSTVLTDEDESMLIRLSERIGQKMKQALKEQKYAEARILLHQLEELNVVEHATIERLLGNNKLEIERQLQEMADQVKSQSSFERFTEAKDWLKKLQTALEYFPSVREAISLEELNKHYKACYEKHENTQRREAEYRQKLEAAHAQIQEFIVLLETQRQATEAKLTEQQQKYEVMVGELQKQIRETSSNYEKLRQQLAQEMEERLAKKLAEIALMQGQSQQELAAKQQQVTEKLKAEYEQKLKEAEDSYKEKVREQEANKAKAERAKREEEERLKQEIAKLKEQEKQKAEEAAAAERKKQAVMQEDLNKFLTHVGRGEQDEAEEMLKLNANLALVAGDLTDYPTGREFKNITGMQYAMWALDWRMWEMIKKYLPEAALKEQVGSFSNGTWVARYGKHVDWQKLLEALKVYVDNYDAWPYEQCNKHWVQQVGGAQLLLPMHVFHEYFGEKPFYPVPDFSIEKCSRKVESWFDDSKLGREWAVCRCTGDSAGWHYCALLARSDQHPSKDAAALGQLYSVRTQQLGRLETEAKSKPAPRPRN